MGRDGSDDADAPSLQDVLDALDDPECRWILGQTGSPVTATELLERCSMSRSTLYRKLDLLIRASFLDEHVRTGETGGRVTRYQRDVSGIDITFDTEDEFNVTVDIERPTRAADERLAAMWSRVGDEL